MLDRTVSSENPSTASRISLGRLLLIFLKIGCIGFGGGMAIISVIEREIVRKRPLIPVEEYLHGVGLGQILGSFAVNVSLFVGYRLYGAAGGLMAAAIFLLPSLAIVIGLSELYFRYHAIPELQGMVGGLGPVVIALILDAGWSIGRRVLRSPGAVAVAALALAAGMLKVNTLWILLCAGGGSLLLMRIRSPAAPGVHLMLLPVASGGGAVATLAGTFLKVGLVFFGGGFVLVPVLHQRLVTELHWLTGREFIDGLAISNLTPGPVAVIATFAGFRQAGVTGALVATAALLAPSAVLMLLFSRQYAAMRGDARVQVFLDGLNPAITGLIVSAAALLAGEALTSWQRWVFACASLMVLRALEWPPIVLLAVAAAGGYFGWLG